MRLIVSGGGTGGHIYPAVAVAKAMKEMLPRSSALFVGTSSGMEKSIAAKENIEFASIRSSGIMGKSLLLAAKGALNASLGLKDAFFILRRYRPDVVLGTGGYVSGPLVLAAKLMGIPSAIQEQNAIPGKTNLTLSRFVDRTFLAWEYSERFFPKRARVKVTGNPVKRELFQVSREEARKSFGVAEGFVLLILGGSRGARTLVDAGLLLAKDIPINFRMIFITGSEYYQKVADELKAPVEQGIEGRRTGNIIIRPYVYNMEMAYNACDLVLARAGGMTLSEITALGLPAVIIPSPNVVGNHQEYNARALEEAGAAVVVREDGDTAKDAVEAVLSLSRDSRRLEEMRRSSKRSGRPNASFEIAKELLSLARGRS